VVRKEKERKSRLIKEKKELEQIDIRRSKQQLTFLL
jgi:hypothetical protein